MKLNNYSLRWLIAVLSTAMLAIAIYLFASTRSEGSIAGCGLGSSCDDVLSSRWGSWLGLSVTACAIPLYSMQMAATFMLGIKGTVRRKRAYSILLATVLLSAFAGIWFLFVQFFFLEKICIFCSVVHLCAICSCACFYLHISSSSTHEFNKTVPLTIALIGISALVIGQQVQPNTKKHDTFVYSTDDAKPLINYDNKTHLISFMGGSYNVSGFPVMGDPSAENVLIEFFDYSCAKCRVFHQYLDSALQIYAGNQLAIVLIPVPYDDACNPLVATGRSRKYACDYAKLSLALWQAAPERFCEFDRWVHRKPYLPSIDDAEKFALSLVGNDRLQLAKEAVTDKNRISQGLEIKSDVFAKKSIHGNTCGDSVPKLVIDSKTMIAGLPSSENEFLEQIQSTLRLHVARKEKTLPPDTFTENEEQWESTVIGNRVEFSP